MGDRGPSGNYDYDDVAFCCRRAHANGQPMSLAISAEYGITPKHANQLISRVRAAGYMIPLVRPDLVSDNPAYLPQGVYEELFTREDWMVAGECRTMPPDMFFPGRGEDVSKAKKVCAGCPVKAECLDYALRRGEKWGVWGGASERERRVMRRQVREEAYGAA